MVHSGFRRIGNLCFINQFSNKWQWLASTASDRKSAKIPYDISWFYPKKRFFFSKPKNKAEFKCLDDSEVLSSDFQDLKTSAVSNDLSGLNSLNSLNDLKSLISSKFLLILMIWSSPAPKWSIPVPFCGIDHQKSNILLISDTLSVGGCWGQPMSIFWKLVDETQKYNPPEATRHPNSIKLLNLQPLRAI